MRTVDDVEKYLQEAGIPYQDLGDGMFIVTDNDSGVSSLAIKVDSPVVIFRMRVGDAPEKGADGREALFEELLRLNGGGLLHSAFSLQDDGIYLSAALPLDNLDMNELQAVVEDMGLAASQHLPRLHLHLSH
ncbi:MAG: YbjN domain-containing protein [Polyangiales bacterium]